MERGYFLPSLRLEADELDAIVLGLRLVTERATPVLDGAAQRAAAKISSALGEAQKERHGDMGHALCRKSASQMRQAGHCP
jgi:predicted DNA-binding transcriptional regulator YafY